MIFGVSVVGTGGGLSGGVIVMGLVLAVAVVLLVPVVVGRH
jgi:hypothetical protein